MTKPKNKNKKKEIKQRRIIMVISSIIAIIICTLNEEGMPVDWCCWRLIFSLLLQASSSSSRVDHSRLNLCCNTSHEFSARACFFFIILLSLSFSLHTYMNRTAAVIATATKRLEIIVLSLSVSLF